jgi:hypothetical protein
MRIEVGKDKKESLVMFFRDPGIDADWRKRALLGVDPTECNFSGVFGATRGGPNEITMATHSLYRVLALLATGVQVPEIHLAKSRAAGR